MITFTGAGSFMRIFDRRSNGRRAMRPSIPLCAAAAVGTVTTTTSAMTLETISLAARELRDMSNSLRTEARRCESLQATISCTYKFGERRFTLLQ